MAQVLGEFFNVLVGKFRQERAFARRACELWTQSATLVAADTACFTQALHLAAEQQFQVWDALILATAASAGAAFFYPRTCSTALSMGA